MDVERDRSIDFVPETSADCDGELTNVAEVDAVRPLAELESDKDMVCDVLLSMLSVPDGSSDAVADGGVADALDVSSGENDWLDESTSDMDADIDNVTESDTVTEGSSDFVTEADTSAEPERRSVLETDGTAVSLNDIVLDADADATSDAEDDVDHDGERLVESVRDDVIDVGAEVDIVTLSPERLGLRLDDIVTSLEYDTEGEPTDIEIEGDGDAETIGVSDIDTETEDEELTFTLLDALAKGESDGVGAVSLPDSCTVSEPVSSTDREALAVLTDADGDRERESSVRLTDSLPAQCPFSSPLRLTLSSLNEIDAEDTVNATALGFKTSEPDTEKENEPSDSDWDNDTGSEKLAELDGVGTNDAEPVSLPKLAEIDRVAVDDRDREGVRVRENDGDGVLVLE
jgi:hypothetical protein